uniref:MULE transposase domain-containing protein n=1 Tax=Lactuca sativa TaxID=4236 RepID=A0A9R1XC53_LACSA|nr:hypothetical protein LSAT_V11C500252220 [Lactuca sativa]
MEVKFYNNNVELVYCYLHYSEILTYKGEDPLEHIQNHIDVNYHFGETSNHNQGDMQKTKTSSLMIRQTTSNLKSTQQLIHMVQHYQCIKTMHHKQVLIPGLEQLEQRNLALSRNDICYAIGKEMFIHNLSKQNIGASRSHRLYTGLQGGSYVRGGLVSDFKNNTRNLNSYIGSRDAKFLVVKMMERKKNIPTFSFEFKVVQKKLNALFWADETTKYNYNAFGDVGSLDATFSMNKYDMVFVPSTGIDNHKKCINFGAGLLSRKDGRSYSWLLRAFLKAFKKQPKLVFTYPDPTLNKAVNEITSQLATNLDFPKRFHSITWNFELEAHDFDKAWESYLDEFKISNNKDVCVTETLGTCIFQAHTSAGLMRTTSLSEGQNWSFQNTTLTSSYLLMFMMTFEGVMERQRCNQIVNDFNTATTVPRFITSSANEPHASKVYTSKIFYHVEKEI